MPTSHATQADTSSLPAAPNLESQQDGEAIRQCGAAGNPPLCRRVPGEYGCQQGGRVRGDKSRAIRQVSAPQEAGCLALVQISGGGRPGIIDLQSLAVSPSRLSIEKRLLAVGTYIKFIPIFAPRNPVRPLVKTFLREYYSTHR